MEFQSLYYFTPILLLLPLIPLLLTKVFFSSKNSKRLLPPSPPSLPIIGHLHLIKKPLHQSLTHLSAKFGPIIYLRLGFRPTIIISSLELAEQCFTTNDEALANRPHFPSLQEATSNFSTLMFSNYGPLWRNLRKIVAVHVFSSRCLHSTMAARQEESRYLARSLFDGSGENKSAFKKINVREIVFEFVLNVEMGMLARKRCYGEEAKDWEEARQLIRKKIEEVGNLVVKLEDFFPFLKSVVKFSKGNRRLVKLMKQRADFTQKLIDDHRRYGFSEKTMIGDLLKLQEREPELYTDDLIKSLTMTLLQAGTDTSSSALEWAMSLLLNNPNELNKSLQEMNNLVGNENRLINESDIPNLPYLRAVINESFRLHPVGPLSLPHESGTECFVGGFRIPPGTIVFVNLHAIQRDPSIWEEPLKFRPERFLKGTNGDDQRMMTFGMGRRKCPGEELAMRMIVLGLGIMIQCFEWERIGEEKVDMKEGSGLTMRKEVCLEAMYRPRPEMVDLLRGIC